MEGTTVLRQTVLGRDSSLNQDGTPQRLALAGTHGKKKKKRSKNGEAQETEEARGGEGKLSPFILDRLSQLRPLPLFFFFL